MAKVIEFIGKSLLVSVGGKNHVVIGDLHLGYDGVLRESGVFIRADIYKQIKDDVEKILDIVRYKHEKIDYIVLLGDLKHEFGSILYEEWQEVLDFIDFVRERVKNVIIIKGNHDVIIEPIMRKKDILVRDYFIAEDVAFLHGDRDFQAIHCMDIKTWLIGHGHPAIELEDGVKKEKYKCFLDGDYKGKRVVILPSFFPIVEGTDPRDFEMGFPWAFELESFEVRIIEEGLEVFDFGKLGKLGL